MKFSKKVSVTDPAIKIRILKALDENKPFGLFKNFYMVRILRNLKRPNVITSIDIWNFLGEHFDVDAYDKDADSAVFSAACDFENVYRR